MVIECWPAREDTVTCWSSRREVPLVASLGDRPEEAWLSALATKFGALLNSIVTRRIRFRLVAAACSAGVVALATLVSPSLAGTLPTPGAKAQVLHLVAAASKINALPSGLTPSLADVSSDFASPVLYNAGCEPNEEQTSVPACDFGDVNSNQTMVLYGDSHAEMWFDAFDEIATQIGWKLVVLAKPYCPPAEVTIKSPITSGPYSQCSQWQNFAVARIRSLHPAVVVITGEFEDAVINSQSPSAGDGPEQWQAGEEKALEAIGMAGSEDVVLGNIADLKTSGPTCLARHPSDVQACSLSLAKAETYWSLYYDAEQAAAAAEGAYYINVLPWLCSTICSPVIGNFDVYFNEFHITSTYAAYLSQILHDALAPAIKASA
jgi:hypothetical protein